MLLPLSGPAAAVGRSMQRAAALTLSSDPREPAPVAYDTMGTAQGAGAAAALAVKRGAKLILGPLFASEVRPALAAVEGRTPVIAFSNDQGLVESGAFVLGITARQSVDTILRYARGRGVRSVVLLAGADGWGRQAADAGTQLAATLGLDLSALDPAQAQGTALVPALRAKAGGELPNAVLVAGGGARCVEVARALAGAGVQLMATVQALDHTPATLSAIEGAWLSAPDPVAFARFAREYEARQGDAPGAIAALGRDGAIIAETLRKGGRMDRDAVLAVRNYPCITGPLGFRADGSCVRRLSVLVATRDGYLPTPAAPST